jgi:hypothetical protein
MRTCNNQIFVEPYKPTHKIRQGGTKGFATIEQKETLVGLKVITDAYVSVGNNTIEIKAGMTVYVSEELLYNQHSVLKTYTINEAGVDSHFMIIDFSIVKAVK